jgi:hypothetical protein
MEEASIGLSLHPGFVSSVASEIGLPTSLIESLPEGSDWLFVVKIHAMIEASLNHLIVHALGGDKRLSEMISKLDTGDRSRGKMAIIKALELLPKSARQFITILSKLRNDLVHDITQFDFTFDDWMSKMPSAEKKTFRESLSFTSPSFGDDETHGKIRTRISVEKPRLAILFQSLEIIGLSADYSMEKFQKLLQTEASRIDGLVASFDAGRQSTPKES